MGDSKLSMMASAMGSSRSRWMVRRRFRAPVGDGVGLLCKVIPRASSQVKDSPAPPRNPEAQQA